MKLYWEVYTDGGSRGNPGPAGVGVVIDKCQDGVCKNVVEKHKFLGSATNNQAEYQALLLALHELVVLKPEEDMNFYLDSRLVVEQVKGNYKMKNEVLKPLFENVQLLLKEFNQKVIFTYIPRERNKRADSLANDAMDEGLLASKE